MPERPGRGTPGPMPSRFHCVLLAAQVRALRRDANSALLARLYVDRAMHLLDFVAIALGTARARRSLQAMFADALLLRELFATVLTVVFVSDHKSLSEMSHSAWRAPRLTPKPVARHVEAPIF